jgi:hypothetical protein
VYLCGSQKNKVKKRNKDSLVWKTRISVSSDFAETSKNRREDQSFKNTQKYSQEL